jgi:hypothetical protein
MSIDYDAIIEKQQDEIERLRKLIDTAAENQDYLDKRLTECENDNERLRQTFKEYGFHHVDCLYETDGHPCDCGYHDVKQQIADTNAPDNRLTDQPTVAPHTCRYCGQPSWLEPIDQSPPPDYCHESDHGERAAVPTPAVVLHPEGRGLMLAPQPNAVQSAIDDAHHFNRQAGEYEALLCEIRDESAEDWRTTKYVVVQMTEETWEKLRAFKAINERASDPKPELD